MPVLTEPGAFGEYQVLPRSSMIWSRSTAAYSYSIILAASFICFSRRAISFSFYALVIFTPVRPLRSAVGEDISIRSRTDLITVLGTMPWALL